MMILKMPHALQKYIGGDYELPEEEAAEQHEAAETDGKKHKHHKGNGLPSPAAAVGACDVCGDARRRCWHRRRGPCGRVAARRGCA